jgi:hypothetical protein
MRAIGLGSVSLVMVTLLVMDAADAASNAWCASYPGKGINDNCSYATQQQCLAQVAFADLIRFQGRRMGPATPGRQLQHAKRGAGIRNQAAGQELKLDVSGHNERARPSNGVEP